MWQAAHRHIQRQLKMRVSCWARDRDWRVIYKEEMIEAKGMDENSAVVDRNQERTLGYLCI